jgi:dephospho-CoA kinase
MIVVGLTGGPGTGKTSVAEILKENGAIILSGDEIGRGIANKSLAILNKLIQTFGKQILDKEMKLNRRKLGKIVFASPQALYKLNEIIHPPLLRMLKSELIKHLRRGSKKIIVIDAALIFEWGIADWCNLILVVTANRDIRIRRMMKNGLTCKEAEDRIASQLPERDKVALADYVIRNNGTKGALIRDTLKFLKVLIDGQKMM